QRPIAPAGTVTEDSASFVLHDGLGRADVLASILQGLFANSLEIVDVEKESLFAVVDAWIEIARHGDVQNDQRSAGALLANRFESLLRHNGFGRRRCAQDDVGAHQGIVEPIPGDGFAWA